MSGAGAMGLMQVMPETYAELQSRYSLGDDPFDPHDNIMAGAAYLREMYDIYGSPGFLAAYNAGPRRLDDYLSNNRPLPDETRRYVAMIGPSIVGTYPSNRSPAEAYAMNALPIEIPPGTRYGRAVQLASNRGPGGRLPMRGPIETAQLPEPPRALAQPQPQQYALVAPPEPPRGRFHLIAPAVAAEAVPLHRGGPPTGEWAIQVGAYSNEGLARAAVGTARQHAHAELAVAHEFVSGVHQGRAVLYRARFTGLSREAAVQACEHLAHTRTSCMVLSPDSQLGPPSSPSPCGRGPGGGGRGGALLRLTLRKPRIDRTRIAETAGNQPVQVLLRERPQRLPPLRHERGIRNDDLLPRPRGAVAHRTIPLAPQQPELRDQRPI
jgi:hypothetical protein